MARTWVILLVLLLPAVARAEATRDRFNAAGYFRIMTRPDFQGGHAKLGLWNLSGRLLNEGPWAALELKLDVLQAAVASRDVWASVHTKIAGGSIANVEPYNGRLDRFGLTQLYVKAGNVLLERVVWQLGTLDSYMGELSLYDMRPAQVLYETVGLSGRYVGDRIEVLLGAGDSGYSLRGTQYSTVLTLGGTVRLRLGGHLELGAGGQVLHEPAVHGNRYAPYATPLPSNASYADYYRQEVVDRYLEENPGQEDAFPVPEPVTNTSYKVVGYLGFGKLGPLRWNNLFANVLRRHPENFYEEVVDGRTYAIYTARLTDERQELNAGNEMQLVLWPDHLEALWGVLAGVRRDNDDRVVASERNRAFYSSVLRLQCFLTDTVHVLTETSLAQEKSSSGNLWREHFDSVFAGTDGLADNEGLEYGDTDTRNTWQLKGGVVLSPLGTGIFTRPSIRLLYGLQYSNAHNAFGTSFATSLDQHDAFRESADRHWHSVVALEAETWF